jgi:hypothetical protein
MVLSGGFSAFAQAPATPPPPAVQPPAPAAAGPDYPDPRSLTIGVFYFLAQPSTGPDIVGGKQATTYETVNNLGKAKGVPGVEGSYPITRTGTIYVDFWIGKGDGNQTTTVQTSPFSQTYLSGTPIATSYKVQHGRVYLDDLLWPHAFPVSKFRLKSLWAIEYTKVNATVDTPGVLPVTQSSGQVTGGAIGGTHSVILPALGIAAEYAIAPHVLLRVDGMGFGIPHHADTWEADATLAWRVNHWEAVVGGKAVHFKTTPNSSEYLVGTLDGAFAELRWHF